MPVDIAPGVVLADDELEWKFIRASGPGGQNVNKVSSAVQLRFNLALNSSIPAAARHRLRRLAGDALERLAALIRAALIEPKLRRKTRPTKASKERRIDSKKRRGSTKSGRSGRWD
jgi:ribosome-associated protein